MGKYSKETIKTVNEADIRKFIPGAKMIPDQKVECPFCHSKNMSVVHKGKKNFAKCFKCDGVIASPIKAVEVYENLKFPESLEYAARVANIFIETEEEKRRKELTKVKSSIRESFCEQQLRESGLTIEDVSAIVRDDKGNESTFVPFQKGGIGPGFRPDEYADDMLIYYIDLQGRIKKYSKQGSQALKKYVRVRWSNPAAHESEDGKVMKYQTPPGAPSEVYIPECIRKLYRKKEHIDTLFIQEGEKKAEKACKHGIPSIGIQGINNFGTIQTGLLADIQAIAKTCDIRNIVLMMDSDWDDLKKNMTVGERADKRARSFSQAVIKFKSQCASLHLIGLNVDVWWGHVNANEKNDKGIDDLLNNSLKGREDELREDIKNAMLVHNGKGTWANVHKISTLSDSKIEEFWALNNADDFFNRHKEKLSEVGAFKIRQVMYTVKDGVLQKQNSISGDADIWSIEENSKGDKKVVFNRLQALELLKNNGYYILRDVDTEDRAQYEWVHDENGIISYTDTTEMRRFIYDYIQLTTRKMMVQEFFAEKLDTILSDKKLERLSYRDNNFTKYFPEKQRRYYNNGAVEITSKDITPNMPMCDVWRSQIVPRKFTRVPIISDIYHNGKMWQVVPTEKGKECEFLQYLVNTCKMHDKPNVERAATEAEDAEFLQHLVNKITAIGFLLFDYKYSNERKVVVAQDNKISEVGDANGGAGKSIFGQAIGKITKQTVIDGKKDMTDKFAFEAVNRQTRNIFIDDVKVNFDFQRLYPMITGEMEINKKNIAPLKIPVELSPKMIITTNNAINKADKPSTARRIVYIEFSSWYSIDWTPVEEFHHQLFDDWDAYQWNLFDNFMAECVMYYMRSYEEKWNREGEGVIPPPMGNIKLRSMRQDMGEAFFQWAEEYFDPTGPNVNIQVKKNDVTKDFYDKNGMDGRHGVTRNTFGKKLKKYCQYKGYDFNTIEKNEEGLYYREFKKMYPEKPFIGTRHSSNGIEFYEILITKEIKNEREQI